MTSASWKVAVARWSDERTAKLLRLRKSGLSFDKIGPMLGVTKNAAIGKWDRMHRKRLDLRRSGVPRDMWTEERLTEKWRKK